MKLFALLLVCIVASALAEEQANEFGDENQGCGKNEKIVPCSKPKWCNTCGIRGNCKLASCEEGCDCKEGFYRNDKGVCIPKSQCPDEKNPGNPSDQCGPNSKPSTCASMCPATCKKSDRMCAAVCVDGCVCDDGYILNDNGKCIPKEKCPKQETEHSESETTYSEEFSSEETYTEEEEVEETEVKEEEVEEKEVKEEEVAETNSYTVEESSESGGTKCGKKEQYYPDGIPNCKNNCKSYFNPGIRCRLGKPGCFCKEGLILREDGECVPPEECKPEE